MTVGAVVQDLALTGGDLPGAAALALSFLAMFVATLGLLALVAWAFKSLLQPVGRVVEPALAEIFQRVPSPFRRRSLSVPVVVLVLIYLVVPTILVILFSFSVGPTTGLPITA